MGLIVRVKVSYYTNIYTDEQDEDLAFEYAENTARENAEADGLKNVDVEEMEITGNIDIPGEDRDAAYEEHRAAQIGCVA